MKENLPKSLVCRNLNEKVEDNVFRGFLPNKSRAFAVSEKVKLFFEMEKIPNVVFIPVNCLGESGVSARKMFFLHPLIVIDCIDTVETLGERSKYDYSYSTIDKLVLDNTKILNMIAINKSLFNKLAEQKFDGLRLIDTSKLKINLVQADFYRIKFKRTDDSFLTV